VRRPHLVAVVLFVSILGTALVPVRAGADTAQSSRRIYAEMVRVGVDHSIADAAGYEVRVDSSACPLVARALTMQRDIGLRLPDPGRHRTDALLGR